jgi:hypothetical protein
MSLVTRVVTNSSIAKCIDGGSDNGRKMEVTVEEVGAGDLVVML